MDEHSERPVGGSPAQRSSGPDPARVVAWKRQVAWSFWSILLAVPTMGIAVAMGYADWRLVAAWAPLSALMAVIAWSGLHWGWSLRLKDPALTLPQIAFSIASTAACYAMLGPMRAVALPMTCLALTFSIFALPPRQVRMMAIYALALFGVVMVSMAWLQPDRHHWAVEAGTFLVLLLVIPGCAVLSQRMSALRETLGRQKSELSRALARIAEIADRDELTGLANRRCGQRCLTVLHAEAQRGQEAFVALIDVDHFKRVNDQHGHAVGDEVLRHFAKHASAVLRPGDLLARWGGEEFLLVIRSADEAVALGVCERVRVRAGNSPLTTDAGEMLTFTVSIGLARQSAQRDVQDTVAAADAALYRAKAAGRNRVVREADGHLPGDPFPVRTPTPTPAQTPSTGAPLPVETPVLPHSG